LKKPEEAVMVGNRISADIMGGNRMGMKTILFKWNKRYPEKTNTPEEQPRRTIRSRIYPLCFKKSEEGEAR
jgi:predicted HAD superfamily phosphohydrolase YqeG